MICTSSIVCRANTECHKVIASCCDSDSNNMLCPPGTRRILEERVISPSELPDALIEVSHITKLLQTSFPGRSERGQQRNRDENVIGEIITPHLDEGATLSVAYHDTGLYPSVVKCAVSWSLSLGVACEVGVVRPMTAFVSLIGSSFACV